jgi:hypothetical protein
LSHQIDHKLALKEKEAQAVAPAHSQAPSIVTLAGKVDSLTDEDLTTNSAVLKVPHAAL